MGMTPTTWVRSHPGHVVTIAVMLLSTLIARFMPVAKADMLDSVNVAQMLGVILAGQLAVLALTVPALFDAKTAILDSPYSDYHELLGIADNIARELRSNTIWTFMMFGVVFLIGVLYDPVACSFHVSLPFGFEIGMVFSALKITCVALSCLAMWDSIDPLFNLGEVKAILTKGREHVE